MFLAQGKNFKEFEKSANRMGYETKVNETEKAVGIVGLSKEQQLFYLEIKELLALAYLFDMRAISY